MRRLRGVTGSPWFNSLAAIVLALILALMPLMSIGPDSLAEAIPSAVAGGYQPGNPQAEAGPGDTIGTPESEPEPSSGISGVKAVDVTSASAAITWIASEPADSVVSYSGNGTTFEPNTSPPVIGGVQPVDVTTTSATIIWTTDEPADSVARYGDDAKALSLTASDAGLVTGHSVQLTGLRPGIAYYYEVRSTDATAKAATDDNGGVLYRFITLAIDTSSPVISRVQAIDLTATSAMIVWTTDESADSVVNYGNTTAMGLAAWDASRVTTHSVLLTGLEEGTTFYYEVRSTDASANAASDNKGGVFYGFTTPVADNSPRNISDLYAVDITATSATITWTTGVTADSVVNYGNGTALGLTASDAGLVTGHSVQLTGLEEGTAYYYEVQSTDASARTASRNNGGLYYRFTTPEVDAPLRKIDTVQAVNVTATSAMITWTTGEPADSVVKYGNSTVLGLTASDAGLTTSHSLLLTGLRQEETYYYEVSSTDAAAKTATDDNGGFYHSFTTPQIEAAGPRALSTKTTVVVDPGKDAQLQFASQKITLNIPSGAVSERLRVEFTEHTPQRTTGMQMVSLFDLNGYAVDRADAAVDNFAKDLTITIKHDPDDLRGLDVDSLNLYYFNDETKQWLLAKSSEYDRKTGILTATVDHFTRYGEQANPVISGPGQIMGYQVNPYSGAAVSTYSIDVPPGSGGFQPKIELRYNSGSVDEMKNRRSVGSWVGTGWSLDLGSISYDADDSKYFLKVNGESYELVQDGATSTYHTVKESFYKITKNGNAWDVYDRDGVYYAFGNTTDSRQYYDDSTYYRWDLSRITDVHTNNSITITYQQDTWTYGGYTHIRSAYPEHVKYNNDNVDIWFYLAAWDVNDGTWGHLRADNPYGTANNPAPKVVDNGKLAYIWIYVDDVRVSRYKFLQSTSGDTYSDDYSGIYYAGKHKLTSIKRTKPLSDVGLPTTSFSYSDLTTYVKDTQGDTYTGNPGNPASFSWPHLTSVTNGYGATVSFSYTEKPTSPVDDIWTREVVTTRTVDPGQDMGPDMTYTYEYTGNPQYETPSGGTIWDDEFRGFTEVKETDAASNYTKHYFWTTGSTKANRLTGKESRTEWYDSSDNLLKREMYTWYYTFTLPYDAYHVHLDKVRTTVGPKMTSAEYFYDSYGNVVKEYRHGEYGFSGTEILKTNGVGSEENIPGAIVSTSPNWMAVDEAVADINTYVYLQPSGGSYSDLYAMQNSNVGTGTIDSVTFYVRTYTEGTGQHRLRFKTEDEIHNSSWRDISQGSWATDSYATTINPTTEQPWTWSEIDDLEAGVWLSGDSNTRCTKVWVEVAFSSSAPSTDDATVHRAFTVNTAKNILNRPNRERLYTGIVAPENSIETLKTNGVGSEENIPGAIVSTSPNWMAVDEAVADINTYVYLQPSGGSYSDLYAMQNSNVGTGTIDSVTFYVRTYTEGTGQHRLRFKTEDEIHNSSWRDISQGSWATDSYATTINPTTEQPWTWSEIDDLEAGVWLSGDSNTRCTKVWVEVAYETADDPASETLYYYDGQGWGAAPTKGALTKLEGKKDASTSVATTYTYDSYGNVLSETSPNGNTTTYTWDSTYRTFPATTTYPEVNGLSMQESYTWDAVSGRITGETDVNGQTTTFDYDIFDRLVTVVRPWDSSTSPTVVYRYNNWGTINQQHLETLTKLPGADTITGTEILRPYAVGSETSISGEYRAGTHYARVDEVTADDDNGYVFGGGAGSRDLYSILDSNVSAGTIDSVKVYYRAKSSTSGGGAYASIRTHDTTYDGDHSGPSTFGWTTFSWTWTSNPYTESAWTWDEIDDLEAGVKLSHSQSTTRCTQVYVEVAYTLGDFIWSQDYFDGTGRVVQTHARGETDRTIISSTSAYDSRGLVDKAYVSQDLASSGVSGYETPDAGWKYTSYVYDGLGRTTGITSPGDTTVSHDYSTPWQDEVTNQRDYKTRYHYDGFGRLIQVEELDASDNLYGNTTYTYDVRGNLVEVRDNDDNTTTMSYDWLSRKTAMSDPDMGNWTYGYDSNSNLVTQTDAKSQTITLSYDALSRLTGKSYPGGSGMTNVSYTYDSTAEGNIGKMRCTGMTDASGSSSYEYDARGRLTEEGRTISSVDYDTSFTYDSAGRLVTVEYPTGETVTQDYNGRGLPYDLTGDVAGEIVDSVTYNNLGQISQINLDNGVTTDFDYWGIDHETEDYGMLYEIKTTEDVNVLQEVRHTWDNGGNLVTRYDAVMDETETFTYDFLDRLTGVSNAYTGSYTYDEIGNMASRNGTSYTYGSSKPHAVTQVGSTIYEYDDNGSMTERGNQTITWDVENRPVTVSDAGGNSTFVYDGGGGRVRKTEGGETVIYVNRFYEKNLTTGNVTSYYYLGGRLVALKKDSDLEYVHQDHLTGTSLTTDDQGAVLASIKYYPFGETRSSSGTPGTDKKFTGQRLDGTGLYFYGARMYDPGLGRFISADTIVPNPANPQSLNRYSYCLNNPLRYVDPSGHVGEDWAVAQVTANQGDKVTIAGTDYIVCVTAGGTGLMDPSTYQWYSWNSVMVANPDNTPALYASEGSIINGQYSSTDAVPELTAWLVAAGRAGEDKDGGGWWSNIPGSRPLWEQLSDARDQIEGNSVGRVTLNGLNLALGILELHASLVTIALSLDVMIGGLVTTGVNPLALPAVAAGAAGVELGWTAFTDSLYRISLGTIDIRDWNIPWLRPPG